MRMYAPLFVLGATFSASLLFVQQQIAAHRRMVHRMEGPEYAARAAARTLHGELQQWADYVQRAPRAALGEVRALDGGVVDVPVDLALWRDQLERFAHVPEPPPALVDRFSSLGHPMFVAAVAALQEWDYGVADRCCCAAVVHSLLERTTGVRGLAVLPPELAPESVDTRRFAAAAVAWRELAERYCGTEAAFRDFLRTMGKSAD